MALQKRPEQCSVTDLALLPENQGKLKLKKKHEKLDSSSNITTSHSRKLSLHGQCICLFKINISDLDGIIGSVTGHSTWQPSRS